MLIGILTSSFITFAQTGVLIGRVISPAGEVADHISVSLEGTAFTTQTNPDGSFVLKSTPGNYRLAVHAVGMQTQVMAVNVQAQDTTIVQKITLEKRKEQLREVVIQSQRKRYKADEVSSSLRLITPLQKVPQNIQVITSKVLDDQQVISLADGVIRNVSGATKLEHWDMYTRINMRGARASEFRNGMNVTSNWGPLSADMSIVDRIEFVKGPAGFMMSNGDPSGIFNIVTKKPTGGPTKGEASVMFGSFDLYRATLDLDGHFDQDKKVLYRLDLMGQTQNSFQKYRFNKRYTIHPVMTYKLDDKTDLTAEYTLQYAKMSNVGAPYAFSARGYEDLPRKFTALGPGNAPTTIHDQSLFLYLEHRFNKDWKLSVHGAWLHSSQVGSSLWPSSVDSAGNMIRTISMFDALNESRFGQAYLNGSVQTGKVHHQILAGLDMGDKENLYNWSQFHDLDDAAHPFNIYHPVYGNPAGGFPAFDRSKPLRQRPGLSILDQSYTGLYVQDELGFLQNRIRLTFAGRYTYVKQSDYGTDYHASKFSPRFGLSVSIDENTSAYALFDQSFLPQSGLLRGNKSPKPLTGNNMEVGIKKNWFQDHWSTTLSVYRILENGKLVSDPDTTGNPNNRYSLQLGQNQTQGVELDIRGQITRGLNVILNYAYTDSKISKALDKTIVGDPIPGFAKHVANGWLTYQIQGGALRGVGFSGGFTFQKDRSTWDWGSANQMQLPDYFRTDAGIFWQHKKMKVNLTVNNVLDKYLYSGAPYGNYYYWQVDPPRNFKLSVAYRF
jgi:iron complex outermembrane receptor protein